ncbi:s-(hydroxymethyl)glutathione dehydrogenase [Caerostris darwini]|uniref:S-(Hydroxymethyl)glutathione dehydrogenase n=1 Tax=Caerostris darwini TaxID=1538125 RepID=A0AAV4PHR6_9ARAC|nr:s-(hydroxymethyl)glutathione dehydrogenase [Caerostris darwini]
MSTVGKPILCRAAVTWAINTPFVLETVEVATPKKGEVRVKMSSTGVCHSDLHILEGVEKDYPFPSVFGHEGAGIVESVGDGVTNIKPELSTDCNLIRLVMYFQLFRSHLSSSSRTKLCLSREHV